MTKPRPRLRIIQVRWADAPDGQVHVIWADTPEGLFWKADIHGNPHEAEWRPMPNEGAISFSNVDADYDEDAQDPPAILADDHVDALRGSGQWSEWPEEWCPSWQKGMA